MADPNIINSKTQHKYSDKDSSKLALHHTLGTSKYQASPGDHNHDGVNSLKVGESASTFSTSTSLANVSEALVASLAFTFKAGRAYRVSYSCRVQMNGGTSPFSPLARLRRSNASGTLFYDPGVTAVISTNMAAIHGFTYLKRTGTTPTTQTIALTVNKNTTGTPTSIDVEASSTAPSQLVIEEIGSANDFTGAIEVPTA